MMRITLLTCLLCFSATVLACLPGEEPNYPCQMSGTSQIRYVCKPEDCKCEAGKVSCHFQDSTGKEVCADTEENCNSPCVQSGQIECNAMTLFPYQCRKADKDCYCHSQQPYNCGTGRDDAVCVSDSFECPDECELAGKVRCNDSSQVRCEDSLADCFCNAGETKCGDGTCATECASTCAMGEVACLSGSARHCAKNYDDCQCEAGQKRCIIPYVHYDWNGGSSSMFDPAILQETCIAEADECCADAFGEYLHKCQDDFQHECSLKSRSCECPRDTPHKCSDGRCVYKAEECDGSFMTNCNPDTEDYCGYGGMLGGSTTEGFCAPKGECKRFQCLNQGRRWCEGRKEEIVSSDGMVTLNEKDGYCRDFNSFGDACECSRSDATVMCPNGSCKKTFAECDSQSGSSKCPDMAKPVFCTSTQNAATGTLVHHCEATLDDCWTKRCEHFGQYPCPMADVCANKETDCEIEYCYQTGRVKCANGDCKYPHECESQCPDGQQICRVNGQEFCTADASFCTQQCADGTEPVPTFNSATMEYDLRCCTPQQCPAIFCPNGVKEGAPLPNGCPSCPICHDGDPTGEVCPLGLVQCELFDVDFGAVMVQKVCMTSEECRIRKCELDNGILCHCDGGDWCATNAFACWDDTMSSSQCQQNHCPEPLIKCSDGTCAEKSSDCARQCVGDMVPCGADGECMYWQECEQQCPQDFNYRCSDGRCVKDPSECFVYGCTADLEISLRHDCESHGFRWAPCPNGGSGSGSTGMIEPGADPMTDPIWSDPFANCHCGFCYPPDNCAADVCACPQGQAGVPYVGADGECKCECFVPDECPQGYKDELRALCGVDLVPDANAPCQVRCPSPCDDAQCPQNAYCEAFPGSTETKCRCFGGFAGDDCSNVLTCTTDANEVTCCEREGSDGTVKKDCFCEDPEHRYDPATATCTRKEEHETCTTVFFSGMEVAKRCKLVDAVGNVIYDRLFCRDGWTGPDCTKKVVDACLGRCNDLQFCDKDAGACKCFDGTGADCSTTTECVTDQCQNGGKCAANGENACVCTDGWKGQFCQTKSTPNRVELCGDDVTLGEVRERARVAAEAKIDLAAGEDLVVTLSNIKFSDKCIEFTVIVEVVKADGTPGDTMVSEKDVQDALFSISGVQNVVLEKGITDTTDPTDNSSASTLAFSGAVAVLLAALTMF